MSTIMVCDSCDAPLSGEDTYELWHRGTRLWGVCGGLCLAELADDPSRWPGVARTDEHQPDLWAEMAQKCTDVVAGAIASAQ